MKIIKPVPITDTNVLSYLNEPYPPYDATSTYALGAIVVVDEPSSVVTINISPSVPADTINWTNHGLLVGTPINFTTTGTLPAGDATYVGFGQIVAGTSYFIESVTLNTFTLSDELGGPIKAIFGTQSGVHTAYASTHKYYQSLQAANINRTPRLSTSSTWWLDLGSSNSWAMFDGSTTSQSRDYWLFPRFTIKSPLDSVALFNIAGSSVRITVVDTVQGELYYKNTSLISVAGINDFWAWSFLPIERLTSFFVTGMPPINSGYMDVWIDDTTPQRMCLCGAMVIGLAADLGGTDYGATFGIQDYSSKQIDTFGNATVLERTFSDKANFTVMVEKNNVDRFKTMLASLRATPAVYVGADEYGSTMIYGWPKDWSVTIAYPTHSVLTIEMEGL